MKEEGAVGACLGNWMKVTNPAGIPDETGAAHLIVVTAIISKREDL